MSAPASAVEAALEAAREAVTARLDFRTVTTKLGAFRASDLERFSVAPPACLLHAVEARNVSRLGDGRVDLHWRWLAVLVHDAQDELLAAAAAERFVWWLSNWRPGPAMGTPVEMHARAFAAGGDETGKIEAAQGIVLWGVRWDQAVRYGAEPDDDGVIPTKLLSGFGGAPRLIYGQEVP